MFECLYCGDCCKRMSPISEGPCPRLIEIGSFVFCGDYKNRPDKCKSHCFSGYHICPIGIDVLKMSSPTECAFRCDIGFDIIEGTQDLQKEKLEDYIQRRKK